MNNCEVKGKGFFSNNYLKNNAFVFRPESILCLSIFEDVPQPAL